MGQVHVSNKFCYFLSEPSSVGSPKVVVEQSLEKSLEAAEPHSNKRPPRNKEVGVSETDKEDATTAQSKKCPKKSGSISESSSDPGTVFSFKTTLTTM